MTTGNHIKFSSMTSVERVVTALRRQVPDRVPHFEWSIHPKVIEGILPGALYDEFIEKTENDAIWVSPSYKKYLIKGDMFKDEWGVIRRIDPVEGYPTAVKGPITSITDLDKYVIPDPDIPDRLESLAMAVKKFKGKKAIGIRLREVLSLPRDLLGYEEFMIATVMEPDLIRRIGEISIEHTTRLAQRAAAMGAEIVMFGDDYCDVKGPLMGPAIFEELFLPMFKRLVANLKNEGLFVIKHTDGNVLPILDLLAHSGIDCLDPIDPMAGLDLGAIKEKYGHIIALKGNVPCAGALQFKTAEDVKAEVRDCIRKASNGGGYICSSSNSIHSGVKPANYKAMMDEIAAYGLYK